MTNVFAELCERIRGEMPELGRAVDRALRAWEHAQRNPGEYAYLDSVALNLHGFYSGVERLLELIARHVDRALPGGDTWHRDLLYQMAGLISALPTLWATLQAELSAFADYLEALGR